MANNRNGIQTHCLYSSYKCILNIYHLWGAITVQDKFLKAKTPWRRMKEKAVNGDVYYLNTETKETSFSKPAVSLPMIIVQFPHPYDLYSNYETRRF